MAHRPVHRRNDLRDCNARTRTQCTNVRANYKPISISGDTNTHSGGGLVPSITKGKVHVNGRPVILLRDSAKSDSLCGVIGHGGHGHCNPRASSASENVRAGNGS